MTRFFLRGLLLALRRFFALSLAALRSTAFFVVLLLPLALSSQDFRVDNEVHFITQDPTGSKRVKSVTYFQGENFISLIGDRGEITFFDSEPKTFTLLDPVLRIQTQISASKSREAVNAQRQNHENNQAAYLAFVAKPRFSYEFDAKLSVLALQSPWMDYRIEASAVADDVFLKRYFEHGDWVCFLNYRINHSLTSLVRLEINRILYERKLFPRDITLSHFPQGKGLMTHEEKTRSTHQLVQRLDEKDRQRIEQAREYRRVFLAVPFEEYQAKVTQKTRQ